MTGLGLPTSVRSRLLRWILVAVVVVCAGVGRARGESGSSTPVADALRVDAETLRADPVAWADCERRVQSVVDEDAALRKEWQAHVPPPLPNFGELDLPVAYLADRLRRETSDSDPVAQALLIALARSKDGRGLDLVLERHDAESPVPDRTLLARIAGESVPTDRSAEVVTKQLARKPRVDRDAELLLLVLEHHGEGLPVDARRAARDWLRTWARGPSNGVGERVWRQRLRLGDSSDRDDLILHLADSRGGLLYCLRVIRDAPMRHTRLAEALRTRREAMNEHERSYLMPHMRIALLVTDTDSEAASYIARIRELVPSIARGRMPTEESREFDALTQVFRTHDLSALRPAMRDLVREPGIDWIQRCIWLGQLVVRGDPDADSLVRWWKVTAPEPTRSYLDEYVAELRSPPSACTRRR